jgi:hypothetical protein
MKIVFDDGGYLEFQRSKKPYHVFVMIAAKDATNPLKLLVNSAEIQLSQLIEAVKSVSGPLMLEGKTNDKTTDNPDTSDHNSEHSEPQVDE